VERTFVLVKPDGVQRSLTGTIMQRLEQRGLKLVAARFYGSARNWLKRIMPSIKASLFMKD
jgi:nucleoside-diphosphate kinase